MTASLSLFERLRRFGQTPGRDAREDRMTEGLASCLEAAPDAAVKLVERVFEDVTVPSGGLELWTQRPVTQFGRADLVLHFGRGSSALRVQFEVKVAAPAERAQGDKYIDW